MVASHSSCVEGEMDQINSSRLTVALYWLLIITPALPYVALNLSYRRIIDRKIAEVESRLTRDIRALYAGAYGDPDIRRSLQKFYHWTTYLAPVALTSLVAAGFATLALAAAGLPLPFVPHDLAIVMARISPIVLAGAGGAYLWGVTDCVQRHATADLSSNSLHLTWVRIAAAAAVGAVLAASGVPNALGVLLAFSVGSLSLADLWAWVRKRAKLDIERGRSWPPDLDLVQGLTQSARDRLVDEDIDSIQRLAFADPVRLLFRTNIEWNVILDVVDQAMLINHVGGRITDLRQMGIRGAIEVAELAYRLESPESTASEKGHAQRMIGRIGASLGQNRDVAWNLAYLLNNEPQVDFIWKNWATPFGADSAPATKRDSLIARVVGRWGRGHSPGSTAAPAGHVPASNAEATAVANIAI